MAAEITYNRGLTYRLATPGRPIIKFRKNRTRVITDPDVIRYCQMTKGFTVRTLEDPKSVEPAAIDAPRERTRRAAKKVRKTTKKKVRRVVD
jgi:hypothetical protein